MLKNNKLTHCNPLGYFSTETDVLKVFIPITSLDFELVQKEDISSLDINALLLRITSDTYDRRIDEPLSHKIEMENKLSQLGLKISNLRRDQKLFIMTYNSTEKFNDQGIA